MAKKTNPDLLEFVKQLKEFNKESASLVVTLQNLASAMKSNAKAASEFTGESVEAFTQSTKEAIDLANSLQGITKASLKDKKQQDVFENRIYKTQSNLAKVSAKIAFLEEKRLTASKQEKIFIDQALTLLKKTESTLEGSVAQGKKLIKQYDELKRIDIFDNLAEVTASVPILNKVFPEVAKASRVVRDNMVEGGSRFASYVKGATQFIGALGKLSLGIVIDKTLEELKLLDQRTTDFRRTLQISNEEAFELSKQMALAASNSGKLYYNSERQAEAMSNLNKTLGTNVTISQDLGENYSALVYRLGLSNEEATKFNLTAVFLGKNAKAYTGEITAQVKLLNGEKRLQIDNRQIIRDISNISARTQLSLKAQNISLVQAAYSAKALGVNMSQLEKTADALLDFESSIHSELEAELLTGREINLEQARLYALNNNMVGLAEELTKQGITSQKFGRMNRIEAEAYAGALGMSAEELASSLQFQDQIRTLSKESQYNDAQSLDDLKKKVALRAKELDSSGKLIGMERALSEIGNEELQYQLEAATFQEQMLEQQKKMTDALIKNLDATALASTFETLKNSIDKLYIAILTLAGASIGMGILNMVSGLRMASTFSKSLSTSLTSSSASMNQIVKGTDKLGRTYYKNATTNVRVSKAAGEQAMQQQAAAKSARNARIGTIGTVGAVVGSMGLDYARSKREDPNDKAGKLMGVGSSTLSGAATGAMIGSIIPGVGTLVGGAVGGILGGIYGAYQESGGSGPGNGNQGVIQTQDSYSQLNPNGGLVVSKFRKGALEPKVQGLPSDGVTLHSKSTPSNPPPASTTTPNKFSEQQMNEMLMYLKQIAAKDTTLRVGTTEWSSAQTIGEVRVQ